MTPLGRNPVARLRKDGRFTEREFGFLRENAGNLRTKVTIPSPAYLARACFQQGNGYSSPDELLADRTEIIRSEIAALRADGVGYVQLDEGFLAMTSRSSWEALYASGTALQGRLQRDIEAENACHDVLEGKIAVLGLVTTKDAHLGKPADLLRRIDEAARFCPLERLAISPQCGFFHGAEDTTMTLDDQWRKLELIVDIASKVWAR